MNRIALRLLMTAGLLAAFACSPSDATGSEEQGEAAEGEAAEGEAAEGEAAEGEAAEGEAAEGEAADGEAAEGEAAEGDTEPASVPAVGSETAEEILAAIEGDGTLTAIITTNMGTFTCELFEEKVPNTVANFAGLAMGLKSYTDGETNAAARGHFYDGLIFHRVIPRFMIQGGDPTGTGSGGPGYRFADEFDPTLRHDRGALLSMANAGANTNGSQFFVTEVPTPHLDNRHSIFGECDDVELVQRIARVPTGPANRPLEDVVMESVRIERR